MAKRFFQLPGGEFTSVPHRADPADYGVDVSKATEVDKLPKYHEKPTENGWETNAESRALADDDMKWRAMSRGEMARFFLDEIKKLQDQIDALKSPPN